MKMKMKIGWLEDCKKKSKYKKNQNIYECTKGRGVAFQLQEKK